MAYSLNYSSSWQRGLTFKSRAFGLLNRANYFNSSLSKFLLHSTHQSRDMNDARRRSTRGSDQRSHDAIAYVRPPDRRHPLAAKRNPFF
jgi:hypothetical protein